MVIAVEAFSQLGRWGSLEYSNSAGVSAGSQTANCRTCGGQHFIKIEDTIQQLTWEGLGELRVPQKQAISLCSRSLTD